MWREVVPALDHLESAVADGGNNAALILDLLKIMAELVPHAGSIEDIGLKVLAIYDKLLVGVLLICCCFGSWLISVLDISNHILLITSEIM